MSGLNFKLFADLKDALDAAGIPTEERPLPGPKRKKPPNFRGKSLQRIRGGRSHIIYEAFWFFRKWGEEDNVFGIKPEAEKRHPELFEGLELTRRGHGKTSFFRLTEAAYDEVLQLLLDYARAM